MYQITSTMKNEKIYRRWRGTPPRKEETMAYSKSIKQLEEQLKQAKLEEKEDKKNKVSTIMNTFIEDPLWKDLLCKDELSAKIVYGTEPPFQDTYGITRRKGSEVIDTDVNYFRAHIENTMNISYSENEMWSIIRTIAERNAFNPLKDHLDSLVWDGVPRLANVLFDYAGVVPRDEAHRALLVKVWLTWTTGLAKRAYEPGCKFDEMFVLDGVQYLGKSAFWRILAGSFFCDTPIDLSSKDAYINIQGVWLYELAEMETITKADTDRQKNFLSSTMDKFRPPYQRTGVNVPRSTAFCGTTNESLYLTDNTGSRRFYTATCEGYIKQDEFKKVRDQVVAEMVHNYKNNTVQTWLSPADHELHTLENLKKTPEDWFKRPITEWIENTKPTAVSLSQVYDGAHIPVGNRTRSFQMRIDKIMKQLGWTFNGAVYQRGTQSQSSHGFYVTPKPDFTPIDITSARKKVAT